MTECPMYAKIIKDVLMLMQESKKVRWCDYMAAKGEHSQCLNRPGCPECPSSSDYILKCYEENKHGHEHAISI